jgi:hypothetical protein
MTISLHTEKPARRGLAALPLGARILIGSVIMAASLFQARHGILELFPSLGADAGVTAAARQATSAASRFIALTTEVYRTGDPPRQTDAAAGPLLDAVFDATVLKTKARFAKADLGALADWGSAMFRVGYVYILAGTGVADLANVPDDPKVLAQARRNVAAYAPEIGRFLDAELAAYGAMAKLVKTDFGGRDVENDTKLRDAKATFNLGIVAAIDIALESYLTPGISDDWRRSRLPVLAAAAYQAVGLLTAEQCGALRDIARAVTAEMGDAVVKGGLDAITATLKCG